jgi:hypothetical protein
MNWMKWSELMAMGSGWAEDLKVGRATFLVLGRPSHCEYIGPKGHCESQEIQRSTPKGPYCFNLWPKCNIEWYYPRKTKSVSEEVRKQYSIYLRSLSSDILKILNMSVKPWVTDICQFIYIYITAECSCCAILLVRITRFCAPETGSVSNLRWGGWETHIL